MKSKIEKKLEKDIIEYLKWIPVVLLVCVLPFVVKYALFESRLSQFAWAPENPLSTDFYIYYKQIFFFWIIGITAICLFILIYLKKAAKFDFSFIKMNIPLGIYLVMTFLSSICSEYKTICFTGCDGQFESFFVIVGYVLCYIYILLLVQTEKDLLRLKKIFTMFLIMIISLAVLQMVEKDPISWTWFQKLITPNGYLESGAKITSVFESNRVSLFAYNPNYAGVMLAMLSAVCYGFMLVTNKLAYKVVSLVLLCLLLLGLIGTGSKAGLLSLIIIVGMSFVTYLKKILKIWYISIPIVTFIILASMLIAQLNDYQIYNNIRNALQIEKKSSNPLSRMVTKPDGVYFTYNDVPFCVSFDIVDESFEFEVTENNNQIPLILSENREVFYLEHEQLKDVTIRPGLIDNVLPVFSITLNGREWMFVKLPQDENTYYFVNQYLRIEQLNDVERVGFYGYEDVASNRLLLWSLSLPLLKDTILLGTGADTFACYFPQNDYKDFYYYFGDAIASSRPHNMYLKIAIESGVVALVALLVFFGGYIIQSLRIYWKADRSKNYMQIGFACFLGVLVYVICGLTNDSMITVAPVFWLLIGTGTACNYMVLKERE